MQLKELELAELRALKSDIEKEIGSRERQQRSRAMDEMKSIAAKYGLKFTDIIGKPPVASKPAKPGKKATIPKARKVGAKKSTRSIKVLYRHPDNPALTWAGGRGRRPQWIKNWEAAGHTLDDLRTPG